MGSCSKALGLDILWPQFLALAVFGPALAALRLGRRTADDKAAIRTVSHSISLVFLGGFRESFGKRDLLMRHVLMAGDAVGIAFL